MTTTAIGPVAGAAVNASQLPATQWQPTTEDIARFESRMNAAQPAEQTAPAWIEHPQSLGDVILRGMENLNESRDIRIKRVNELVDGVADKPMNFADGMRLQLELMQLNLHHEVTTKTADKTSQGVQTLFRNQ